MIKITDAFIEEVGVTTRRILNGESLELKMLNNPMGLLGGLFDCDPKGFLGWVMSALILAKDRLGWTEDDLIYYMKKGLAAAEIAERKDS